VDCRRGLSFTGAPNLLRLESGVASHLGRRRRNQRRCEGRRFQKVSLNCNKKSVPFLLRFLRLQVLVRPKRKQPAHKQHAIQRNAKPGLAARALARPSSNLVGAAHVLRGRVAGHALQGADDQAVEDLARLVAVPNILEGFSCVLPADV
jgi:hypothetical protein